MKQTAPKVEDVNENARSDIEAKRSFVKILATRGYENIEIKKKPSDIIAYKNGEKYFFEIKVANKVKRGGGFGAATITEWEQALMTPNNYFFVIAWHNGDNENFEFHEYSTLEFLKCSTIPPFKIYFKIYHNGIREKKRRTAVEATENNIKELIIIYDGLQNKS